METITKPKLDEIKNKNESLILEYYSGEDSGLEKLWIFYDSMNFNFVLVHQNKDKNNKRSFNHIIFDYSIYRDYTDEVPEIFEKAIKKIKEEKGKCFEWKINNNFIELLTCNYEHF